MSTKLDCATISEIEENLIRTVYCEDCLINPNHLERIREVYTDIMGSEDLSLMRLLVIFEGGLEISRDIGERYLTDRVRPKVGEAFVTSDNKTTEYLKAASAVMKNSHPVEVFSTEAAAKDWLLSL